MRSAAAVVPGIESPAEWEHFRAGVTASLNPVGVLEETLADRASGLLWRMRRVERFESLAVAAGQAELEMPTRPRTDGDALEDFDKQDRMTDAEFLADREQSAERARETIARWRTTGDMARRLTSLPDDEQIDRLAALSFAQVCVDFAKDEGAGPALPDSNEPGSLLKFAGLSGDAGAVTWSAATLRTVVTAVCGTLKQKRTPIALLKEIIQVAEDWVEESTSDIEELEPDVAALRKRLTLRPAIACARRVIVDNCTANRITRYEGHLQRQLTKTLDELDRLQVRRLKTTSSVD
jgi:hypothetical protein